MELAHIIEKVATHHAQLVAVSKTHSIERLAEVYAKGQRIFGENRVQELITKYDTLPKDIAWHFIGTLQTNKVRQIAPFVAMIHAVDSLRLLEEIDKQAAKCGRSIPCLLQLHIAQEETKHGFTHAEIVEMLETHPPQTFEHITFAGVMGMATYTEDQGQIKAEFGALTESFRSLKATYFAQNEQFKEISMGMSGDWELALTEGSTMVRIGSLIFGGR
jgi:PLP dependent protein